MDSAMVSHLSTAGRPATSAILIDDEFRRLTPPLSTAEHTRLEAALVRKGCLFPLMVWAGHDILLDGHNRFEICTRLGIPYEVLSIELPDRAAARAWIAAHQKDQRNLTADGLSHMRGSVYLAEKRERGRPPNGAARRDGTVAANGKGCHRDTFSAANNGCGGNDAGGEKRCHRDTFSGKTARQVGLRFGVTPRTILRDARYTEAVDRLAANCGDDVRRLAARSLLGSGAEAQGCFPPGRPRRRGTARHPEPGSQARPCRPGVVRA
jgi:hypothetical protein